MTPSTQDARATGLVELAVRCEQATGADAPLERALIREAWDGCYPAPKSAWRAAVGFNDEWHAWNRNRAKVRRWLAAGASLDAARSLIGKDAFWRLGNDGEGPDVSAFKATVTSGDGPTLTFHDAVAAAPALALTAAALRALAASTKDQPHDA